MRKNHIIILAGALVFLAVLGFVSVKNRKAEKASSSAEPVACTMEALTCPDGSSVGREAPQCQFGACPNMESFSGRLTEEEGKHLLAIRVPDGAGGEMNYSLPLNFRRVSNALAEFIGKDVRVKGSFSAGNTLDVETIETLSEVEETERMVKIGEAKNINGVRVALNKIVEDSRCPIDAMCIQEGKLVANVTLKSGDEAKTLDMTFDAKTEPYAFGNYRVSIIGASPSRKLSEETKLEDYELTFKVLR